MSTRFQGSSSAKYSVRRQFDVIVCAVGVTAAAIRGANAATGNFQPFTALLDAVSSQQQTGAQANPSPPATSMSTGGSPRQQSSSFQSISDYEPV